MVRYSAEPLFGIGSVGSDRFIIVFIIIYASVSGAVTPGAAGRRPKQCLFFCTNVMAAVDSLLNAAPPVPPENVMTQQPFASITAYFFSKTDTSPVWTIGFRCRSDQNYKAEGALVFCTNDKCKNSAGLPAGHKNDFPFFREWKIGDSNQIMQVHCRNTHEGELSAFIVIKHFAKIT